MITDLRKQMLSLAQMIQLVAAPAFSVASPNQFSPKSGSAGTQITIPGRNFALGGFKARFDSVNSPGVFANAEIFSGPTDTQVVIKSPAVTPGPYKITVQTIFGSKTSDDNFQAT